jgi:transcriptional regulator with XRE-family HTH domain
MVQIRLVTCDIAGVSPDFDAVAAELVRALRGQRSQVAVSRRLGFRTNVLHTWERRKRSPSAGQLLAFADRTGVDLKRALTQFFQRRPAWLDAFDPNDADSVKSLLQELRGALSIAELSRQSGFSRFALARWLTGAAQPKSSAFLALVHHGTQRLPDFVDAFTDAEALPSLRAEVGRLHAAREVATRRPWSQLLLRLLELPSYRALPRHQPGWMAARAGISLEEERATLALLIEAGQVERGKTHYRPRAFAALDMRHERETAVQQRAFWAEVAARRAPRAPDGLCAYKVCALSRDGYRRLKDLQRRYLVEARALIAESQPEECAALLQVSLLPFDAE